ncbi:unnamed protein product [Ceratitis capitata]|uniref:(Mediterranean fruit fly) hypothetical protein n=1 Tax=Ceratitis capitata TaxID=7213 RepID=A0A811VDX3_CERCA|nr:unnamed protein product [Ceratitis capitata]
MTFAQYGNAIRITLLHLSSLDAYGDFCFCLHHQVEKVPVSGPAVESQRRCRRGGIYPYEEMLKCLAKQIYPPTAQLTDAYRFGLLKLKCDINKYYTLHCLSIGGQLTSATGRRHDLGEVVNDEELACDVFFVFNNNYTIFHQPTASAIYEKLSG